MINIRKYNSKEVIDIIRGSVSATVDKDVVRLRKFIGAEEMFITSKGEGPLFTTEYGLKPKNPRLLLIDYLRFLYDSGAFKAHILSGHPTWFKGHVAITLSNLYSYELSIVDLHYQSLIAQLENCYYASKEMLSSEDRYSGLRMATIDEIRHLIAVQLYYQEALEAAGIRPIEALEDVAEYLDDPRHLFEILAYSDTNILNQVKKFRAIAFSTR
jgi:hypothetical protein